MSLKIPLNLISVNEINRAREPITWGVPLSKGELFSIDELCLKDSSSNSLVAYFEAKTFWPDGSIKWFLLDFQIDFDGDKNKQVTIERLDNCEDFRIHQVTEKIKLQEDEKNVFVDTGATVFTINKSKLTILEQVRINNRNLLIPKDNSINFIGNDNYKAIPSIVSTQCNNSNNDVKSIITQKGFFRDQNDELLAEFRLVLCFYAGKETVKIDFSISNPHASNHEQNLWDLGDSGSLFFKDLSVEIALDSHDLKPEITIKDMLSGETHSYESDNFLIYQDSSGGENWQSKNHINHQGAIPLRFRGYHISSEDQRVISGYRTQPIIQLKLSDMTMNAYVEKFWQNFPKAVEVGQNKISIKLFPQNFSDTFELQGGEQKTHTFYLDFSTNEHSLDWAVNPLQVKIPLEMYAHSEAFPWLPGNYESTQIQNLIKRGIHGENNFFEKREAIDEYGWRNFGDIFADHEYLEYKGKDPLISHYNNQYDALYGMLRQYIMTADTKWFELATDLARHIIDIDIYHTSEDRDEYNCGLFWHTDHYLNAYTCTHRTFSIHQFEDEMSYQSGGGPGSEHCYTTGLTYFYFLTGHKAYKTSVLKLIDWVTISMDGSGTVLERIVKFKNQDLPVLKKLLRGQKVQINKYPLTRATGNYISALIDGYSLTDNKEFILRVENIISQTVHPGESIELRNLANIERGWSYLILLQSICKYLNLKVILNELDDGYDYAVSCLINYANWMVKNESPFLDKEATLDYPNHTWVAQDLRKANILFIASTFSTEHHETYIEKAKYFLDYVVNELKNEETRYYTRILVILMQNEASPQGLTQDSRIKTIEKISTYSKSERSYDNFFGVLFTFFKDIFTLALTGSIKNEIRWLKFRLKK